LQTNIPLPTFGDTGFVAQPEAVILAGAQADIDAAFGGGLNPSLKTPQGQLASSEAAVIGFFQDLFVKYTQQVDPAYSSGRMQDGIGRIYYLKRNPALPTVVACVCTGLENVIIPQGALVQDTTGNQYQAMQAGTIGPSGTVTIPFANLVNGPIPCPANSLTKIIRANIPGWDTINNPEDGALGALVEGRAAFEYRRGQTVAGNSFGQIGAIIGAVAKVNGVLDWYGYDNGSPNPVTVANVTIAGNSIYIAVVGGTDQDVAQAILSKKGGGCAYTGNTTVTAFDSNPLYSAPIPYTVKFERPDSLSFLFAINLVAGPNVPSDAVTQIQGAVIAAFAGTDSNPRPRIAALVLASWFWPTLQALGPWVQIRTLKIGSNNTLGAEITGSIAANTLTVGSVISGTVAIGQTISGDNVVDGTQITGGSGSTWTVNNMQTVTSEDMLLAVANQDEVQVNGDQEPTITAPNIVVTVT
jgi:hypothetical protein